MKSSFSDIINSDKPVLIDFHATWCGPCHAMAPVIKDVAGDYKDQLRIIKIDVDKNRPLSTKYGIQGVPTFMLFKDGQMLWRQSGMITRGQIRQILTQNGIEKSK